jgi:hypothetical protein
MQNVENNVLPLMVLGVTDAKTKGERVTILANRNVKLHDPAAIVSLGSKVGIARKITKAVAIPPMDLACDDQILLYTKQGRYSAEVINGSTIHRVYLGLRKPLWGGLRALRIVEMDCLGRSRRLTELRGGEDWGPLPAELPAAA